jgi:hypothetical protein
MRVIAKADIAGQITTRRNTAMQLANFRIHWSIDPDQALNFVRSTRTLVNPNAGQNNGQSDQELHGTHRRSQIAKDPKRAFLIAEDSLKVGSRRLNNVLQARLRAMLASVVRTTALTSGKFLLSRMRRVRSICVGISGVRHCENR